MSVTATETGVPSPMLTARSAGFFYLLNITTIFASIYLSRGLVVPGDAAATSRNILAHETQFWSAYAFEVVSTACSLAVAALLYELLRPVNRGFSMLAAFFRVVACAIAAVGYLFQLTPLRIADAAQHLSSYNSDQLQAIGFLLSWFSGAATRLSIVFFGFHFLVLGLLIFRSRFLPRVLGLGLMFAGVGGLMFLAPQFAVQYFFQFAALGLVAEGSIALWLLGRGVNAPRWRERVAKAGAC